MMSERLILVGRILGAHGLRGDVKLESFMQDPAAISQRGPLSDGAGATFSLRLRRAIAPTRFVAQVQDVDSRSKAEALAGKDLYLPRSRLPEPASDEFYYADLIGLSVMDQAGAPVGTIVAVADYGAGALLEVRGPGGDLLLPFNAKVVRSVDLHARMALIALPSEVSAPPPGSRNPPLSERGT